MPAATQKRIGADEQRLEELESDTSARRRHVCSQLTGDLFAAQLNDVAGVTLRYGMPSEYAGPYAAAIKSRSTAAKSRTRSQRISRLALGEF